MQKKISSFFARKQRSPGSSGQEESPARRVNSGIDSQRDNLTPAEQLSQSEKEIRQQAPGAAVQSTQAPWKQQGLRRKPSWVFSLFVFLFIFSLLFCAYPHPAYAAEEEVNEPTEPEQLAEAGLLSAPQQRHYAVPGGQSIGVLLSTDGVTVVGFSPAVLGDGSMVNPAEEAGLITGDFITSINGETVLSNADISRIISEAGERQAPCVIHFIRSGYTRKTELHPVFCQDSQSWRIGLYVRDNVCGVGTLTYYDVENGQFAALGHEVADIQHDAAGDSIGSIIRASVQSIRAGSSGVPGEKLGAFLNEEWNGDIWVNGSFGVYGKLNSLPETSFTESVLPIAFPNEVQNGPAQSYTVLEGEKIESFSVNIVKTLESHKSSGHGMILEITDPRLIDKCGGIVQGMSGSPIVQNGLLVGAVTHVFVNDPLHGYGCFAQWMLEEAEESSF